MINRQEYYKNKENNKQKKIAAGLMLDRFPKVSGIAIHLTYHHKSSNRLLMVRTVNFSPKSYAYFKLNCLTKGCNEGNFELTPLISNMIKKHTNSLKGKLVCSGKKDSPASSHARISYEIGIKYNKNSK